MNVRKRAKYSALVGTLDQAKLCKHSDILTHTLDVARNPRRQLALRLLVAISQ